MPAYFRSQHPDQAWLTALVAIMDLAAVFALAAKDDLKRQAELTFETGHHVPADITVVLGREDDSQKAARQERLSPAQHGVDRQRIASKGPFSAHHQAEGSFARGFIFMIGDQIDTSVAPVTKSR